MQEFTKEIFNRFWKETEVICEYSSLLWTFGDMKLPYIFLAEHGGFNDRVIIHKGVIQIRKPNIILPGRYSGPEFTDGFEKAGQMTNYAAIVMRSMGLPYSNISNKTILSHEVEYGKLSDAIEKYQKDLNQHEDVETGLIKGLYGGAEVSLMRYSAGLMIKSAGENVKQYIDHIRRQRGEPIRPDEKITDEDIEKLFG